MQVNNYKRGKVIASAENESLLGSEKWFEDMDWDSTGVITRTTGLKSKCRWVMNDSGGALTARACVKYKAAYFGTRVDNEADAGDKADGIVDEFATGGTVANQAYFWLVINGITEAISDGNSTLAQGDVVVTVGSGTGKVRKQDPALLTTSVQVANNTRVGVVAQSAVTAVDGTTFRIFMDAYAH